jgi:ssDNA thymidine ADP-ribosyltransferase, DarT
MPRSIDLYHITHIDNLASIIRCGGLLSNTCLQARNKVVRDISYGNIQDRRATKHVPCAAFYDDLDDLERIDWCVMKSRLWFDTDNDPNRKCKRQAEFLVYSSFPWDLIQEIGVINQSVQAQVRQILQQVNDFTSVNVYADWYY